MKKWLPIIIVFVILVFGIWFWSLGRMPAATAPVASIEQIDGQVEYQEVGHPEWVIAFDHQTIKPGSTIRTHASSTAILAWFGRAQTRISEDTTLKIDTASQTDQDGLHLSLSLEQGRMWSRLVHVLDLNGEVQAKTSDIIATVRGTAFDLQKPSPNEATTLWVADSVVHAQNLHRDDQAVYVAQGNMIKIGAETRTTSTQPISDAGMSSAWFQSNQGADHTFINVLRSSLKQTPLAATPPLGGVGQWLQARSFDLHLALAGKNRVPLARQLFLQDLLSIRNLFDEGRSGYAVQQFNEVERELKGESKPSAEIAALTKEEQASVIKQVLLAFDDRAPESSMFSLKQRMEDILLDLSTTNVERMFHRLYGISERLDEASESFDQNDVKQADVLTDIAQKSLDNYAREAKDWQDSDPAKAKIDSIQQALILRAATLRKDVTNMLNTQSVTSTTTGQTQDVASLQATTTCQGFRLTIPVALTVGSSTTMKTTVTNAGKIQDVTASTTFIVSDLLSLKGAQITALQPGKATIDAAYTCDGNQLTSNRSITNQLPVSSTTPVVIGLDVSLKPSSAEILGTSQVTVLARMQDGQSVDVTKLAKLHLSDTTMASINGSLVTTFQTPGSTDVIADYSDGSIGWTGKATLTITSQSVAAPATPTSTGTSTQKLP